MEKLEGPATRNTAGAPTLPNLSNMLTSGESPNGLSNDRRWGVKSHLERLDPDKDAPQAFGVPFDWGRVYEREVQKIRALSPES